MSTFLIICAGCGLPMESDAAGAEEVQRLAAKPEEVALSVLCHACMGMFLAIHPELKSDD